MISPDSKVNGSLALREWHLKTATDDYDLAEVYLNGGIVFRKNLTLYLPETTVAAPINLTTFILNHPDYEPEYDIIIVYNLYDQPTIITGDLAGHDVELINNGEIQGYDNGEDALIITTPAGIPQEQQLKLTNNGYIRAAGGLGGCGGTGGTGGTGGAGGKGANITTTPGSTTFTSSGTFNTPVGITSVGLCMIGAGGAGCLDDENATVGGGHAGSIYTNASVATGSSSYNVVIGAGGSSQSTGNNGLPGTASSFGGISAAGGAGGTIYDDYYGDGLTKPANCHGTYTDGTKLGSALGGEAGFGNGGNGATDYGNDGQGYGSGGGGAADSTGLNPYAGDGANGYCLVTWGSAFITGGAGGTIGGIGNTGNPGTEGGQADHFLQSSELGPVDPLPTPIGTAGSLGSPSTPAGGNSGGNAGAGGAGGAGGRGGAGGTWGLIGSVGNDGLPGLTGSTGEPGEGGGASGTAGTAGTAGTGPTCPPLDPGCSLLNSAKLRNDSTIGNLNGCNIPMIELELELPSPSSNAIVDLETFIAGNNPYNAEIVTVTNNFVQPTITSGSLTGMQVTFINNNEIQGRVAGADALIVESSFLLINNSYIRGAGGQGGNGGSGDSITKSVGTWIGRGTYDDGDYTVGGTPSCVVNSQYYNRFWKSGGGANSGAWVQTGCTNQEYFDTAAQPIWGDQGRTRVNTSGSRMRDGIEIVSVGTQVLTGGSGGTGGQARRFQVNRTNGTNGTNATVTGTNPGFNTSTGVNYSLTVADDHGGDGGDGGDWYLPGTSGEPSVGGNSGTSGGSAGAGINNIGLLDPASILGHYELDITPPVITILGLNPTDVDYGSTYTDSGATAVDDQDGDITADIQTVNNVNTSNPGAYNVTYNVQDEAGNSATQQTRVVNVLPAVNYTPATYVGGRTQVVSGTTGDTWFSFVGLTDGIDTQPAIGDTVVVTWAAGGESSQVNLNSYSTPAGYTSLSNGIGSSIMTLSRFAGYKKLTSADTGITIVGGTTDVGAPLVATVMVFRGTFDIGLGDTGDSGSSLTFDPAAISLENNDMIVLTIGAVAHNSGLQTYTNTGYTKFISAGHIDGTNAVTSGIGYTLLPSSGNYDPQPFGFSGTGSGFYFYKGKAFTGEPI